MAKTGRPKKEVNWELLARYAEAHCNQSELAQVAGIDVRTLKNTCLREHGVQLMEWIEEQQHAGKAALKMLRWRCANNKHWRSIQWLSQHWLGEMPSKGLEVTEKRRTVIIMPSNGREVQLPDKPQTDD